MRRKNKKLTENKESNERGLRGNSFRNRVGDKIPRLNVLKRTYEIRLSKEPIEDKRYILTLESETAHGYNYERILKGTYQECEKLKEELENV